MSHSANFQLSAKDWYWEQPNFTIDKFLKIFAGVPLHVKTSLYKISVNLQCSLRKCMKWHFPCNDSTMTWDLAQTYRVVFSYSKHRAVRAIGPLSVGLPNTTDATWSEGKSQEAAAKRSSKVLLKLRQKWQLCRRGCQHEENIEDNSCPRSYWAKGTIACSL